MLDRAIEVAMRIDVRKEVSRGRSRLEQHRRTELLCVLVDELLVAELDQEPKCETVRAPPSGTRGNTE